MGVINLYFESYNNRNHISQNIILLHVIIICFINCRMRLKNIISSRNIELQAGTKQNKSIFLEYISTTHSFS